MIRLLYIGNKLNKHGYTSTSIDTLGVFLEREGFKIYYASSKKSKFLRIIDMIGKTIKYRNKIDFVLIDTYSTFNFWYTVVISQLCRVLNIKYIPKLHGGDLPRRIKRNPFCSNLIFNNSFINITPSNYLYEAFYKNGYTNLVYIPNTIEIQNYPFIKREVIVPKLLWVRSFSKIYNPIMAVKVLVELKKEYPNATLCMIGPKKDESYIESVRFATKNKVEVNFTGKLSKFEWITLSNSSNIFLNTTHFDNTPISVIEAMALGIPVVSTNVGGIPFLLEHEKNALLVSDNDVNGMVLQIKKLLKNPEQTNIIVENARETVNNFDWEIVKLKWIELLKVHNK